MKADKVAADRRLATARQADKRLRKERLRMTPKEAEALHVRLVREGKVKANGQEAT